jgi:hypothetical protein
MAKAAVSPIGNACTEMARFSNDLRTCIRKSFYLTILSTKMCLNVAATTVGVIHIVRSRKIARCWVFDRCEKIANLPPRHRVVACAVR